MAHGPDWSDSEDSLFEDDGDYINFKSKARGNNIPVAPQVLTEEDKQKQDITEFFNAISTGSIETVEEFISKGFDINLDLRDGWTAIMLAASYGNPDITGKLIEYGANINQDRDAVTPLMMGCNCPEYTSPFDRSFAVIKLLVEKGASVQAINRKRMDALMYAACNGNLQAVEYLLPKANKEAVDNQRWSALTWAVSNNQTEVVRFLWENGFEIDLMDVRGNTALDLAKENGLEDIINIFPRKDSDVVAEILGRSAMTFEETFSGLSKGEKPAFFEDICNFLLSVKCSHLIPLFLDQNVTLDQFLAMDEDNLKQIGVHLPYQRNRILTGLHRFHKQPYHPKSLHVCIKSGSYSNVDVATELMSAVKQVIAMEASLKYLLKHLAKQELSKEDREMVTRNIKSIKLKIKSLRVVSGKLDSRFRMWDSKVTPADLITKNSIKSQFPWKKFSFCFGIFSLVLVCKFKNILLN